MRRQRQRQSFSRKSPAEKISERTVFFLEFLAERAENPAIRLQAIKALGDLQSSRSLPLLERLLITEQDPQLRAAARLALMRCTPPKRQRLGQVPSSKDVTSTGNIIDVAPGIEI